MLFITKYNYANEHLLFICAIYTHLINDEYISIDISKNYIFDAFNLNISFSLWKKFPELFKLIGAYNSSEILDKYMQAIKILKDNKCSVIFNDDILVFE